MLVDSDLYSEYFCSIKTMQGITGEILVAKLIYIIMLSKYTRVYADTSPGKLEASRA